MENSPSPGVSQLSHQGDPSLSSPPFLPLRTESEMSRSLTAAQTAPAGESKLSGDLVRLQIRVFMTLMKRIEDQQAENLEMMAAMLRAQGTNLKQLESEVAKFRDLLESHDELEGLEDTLELFVETMYDSRVRVDLAVEGLERSLAQMQKRNEHKNEHAALDSPGA